MGKLGADVFILAIGGGLHPRVHLTLAAQVDDVELAGKLGQGLAQDLVDGLGALAAAHHQEDGPGAVEAGKGQALFRLPLEEGRPDGGAGKHAFGAHLGQGILKGDAHRIREPGGDAVGQAGGIVGFMGDHRGLAPGGDHHGHGHESALREHHIGLHFPDDPAGLEHPFEHPEGVRKILQGKIPAQLSGADGMVANVRLPFHQAALDAVGGAHIVDGIAGGPQLGQQGQVGGHVAGGTAAGEQDGFGHGIKAFQTIYVSLLHSMQKKSILSASLIIAFPAIPLQVRGARLKWKIQPPGRMEKERPKSRLSKKWLAPLFIFIVTV